MCWSISVPPSWMWQVEGPRLSYYAGVPSPSTWHATKSAPIKWSRTQRMFTTHGQNFLLSWSGDPWTHSLYLKHTRFLDCANHKGATVASPSPWGNTGWRCFEGVLLTWLLTFSYISVTCTQNSPWVTLLCNRQSLQYKMSPCQICVTLLGLSLLRHPTYSHSFPHPHFNVQLSVYFLPPEPSATREGGRKIRVRGGEERERYTS